MKMWMAPFIAAVIGLIVTWASGYIVIPFMHKLKFGQTILDIGPSWQKKKQGTPTMGGIMFIAGTILAYAVVFAVFRATGTDIVTEGADGTHDHLYIKLFAGILMSVGFAFIGFIDDYIKVVKKRNLGLTEKQKTLLQILVIGVFLGTIHYTGESYTILPYLNTTENKVLFWILGYIAIYGTVNAANFTDGIDGLCSSVTSIMCVAFGIVAVMLKFAGVSVLSGALCGSLLGFIIWNRNPARIMMGDIGSLFLGGMICTFAYCLNAPWLIILISFIYVVEFATDLIQIAYSVTHRGKRLFKMAPLHHHYEKSGWSENRICVVFSLITILCSVAAIALVHFGITAYNAIN